MKRSIFIMSTLNLLNSLVAYNDTTAGTINNNPKIRIADINRSYFGLNVQKPQSQNFVIPPGASLTLYDGGRTTAIDVTTTFSLTNTSGATYQMYYDAGTPPAFRTARAIATTLTTTFNVAINNNSVVSFTQNSGPSVNFSSVVVGDILYVSSNSLFNIGNQGYFPIIAKGANYVQIQNPVAAAESNISLGANFASDFQIFSSAGVQIGDTAVISAGFSPVTQGSYPVTAVAPSFFEFSSANPLPIETSITATVAGLNFYSQSKFLTYIETNQSCFIRFDSDVTNVATIEPFAAGDGALSMYVKTGNNYKAILTNRSVVANCVVYLFTAEK